MKYLIIMLLAFGLYKAASALSNAGPAIANGLVTGAQRSVDYLDQTIERRADAVRIGWDQAFEKHRQPGPILVRYHVRPDEYYYDLQPAVTTAAKPFDFYPDYQGR